MGIIKTAMMSGVGIYGIKQLAKTQEHRHSSPAPADYPRDNYNYPPQGQGYWGPPGPPPRGPRQSPAPREDAYYGENPDQQQRQWYPAQPADGRYSRDYQDEKYTAQDGDYVYQARERQYNTPPPYGAQQQQAYQQPALPYEPRRGSPSSANAAGLLNTAMQFVGNQQDSEENKGKKGKGSDMVNDFLSK